MIPLIFSRIHEGAQLKAITDRAMRAASQSYHDPKLAQELIADPQAETILPLFGYMRESQQTPAYMGRVQTYQLWRQRYPFPAFWKEVTKGIAKSIQTEGLPDGRCIQRLRAESITNVWNTARTHHWQTPQSIPCPDEALALPAHIATILALTSGPSWQFTENGMSLERLLPAHPLRLPGSNEPLNAELKNGLLVSILCWAVLPANSYDNPNAIPEVVFASFVGPQKKLNAAKAAIMDNKRDLIKLPFLERRAYDSGNDIKHLAARRLEGKGRYRFLWNDSPLAESGQAHLALHMTEDITPRPGQPFPHVVGRDGTPHLELFFAQLDLALNLPLKMAWKETLWSEGLAKKLIIPIPSFGCQTYWVRAQQDSDWAKIVSCCAGAAQDTAGQIETFGTVKKVLQTIDMPEQETDEETGEQ